MQRTAIHYPAATTQRRLALCAWGCVTVTLGIGVNHDSRKEMIS